MGYSGGESDVRRGHVIKDDRRDLPPIESIMFDTLWNVIDIPRDIEAMVDITSRG